MLSQARVPRLSASFTTDTCDCRHAVACSKGCHCSGEDISWGDAAHLSAVVLGIVLPEGSCVDLHNGALHERLRPDQLVV